MSKIVKLPLLPLRDVIAFPGMTIPLFVGREKSINSVNYADEYIFLISQKDSQMEEPVQDDLYEIGIVAKIKKAIVLSDNTLKVLVEGETIARLKNFIQEDDKLFGEIEIIENKEAQKTLDNQEHIALRKTMCSVFDQYMKAQKKFSVELSHYLENISDSFKLVYIVATHMELPVEAKQRILENQDSSNLIETVIGLIESEMDILQAERRIRSRIKSQIEKNQKEYYLNEQMKAIQKELGEADDFKEELARLEAKIEKTKFTESAHQKAKGEFKKLKSMNPMSAEASIVRNYLDFLVALPWGKHTPIKTDLDSIKEELELSHYGMKKAKERIYELIIQRKRVKDIARAPVLCFHGSPGTGKTTLAYAAGKAMGLKTMRISLGGIRDEAVLRGHRRTYIGAMPGKIMQAIKDAQSSNLLIIFDEIGAIGRDFRGNPEDVLLEIFDPIQNKTFQDHYVEEGFDLSGVIFMCTTNSLDLNPALLDRLEIIDVSGYSQEEKHKIANEYILPKLLKEYGVKESEFIIENQNHIDTIIRDYTYESGVRGLEQKLATLVRKAMCKLEESANKSKSIKNSKAANKNKDNKKHNEDETVIEMIAKIEISNEVISKILVNEEFIKDALGKPIYTPEDRADKSEIGVATGLAYVEKREGQEGEVLYIEAKMVPGDGKVECTGRLGDVMKESAQVAFKYLLSNAEKYGVDLAILKEKNIHVHLPAGAVPKDGPSAGVAFFCAMLSAIKNIPIRNDIAITGEISLYKVLKVGGIKEKILAAYRRVPKINKIYIPFDNLADLDEIPENVKASTQIMGIKSVDEVVAEIFEK